MGEIIGIYGSPRQEGNSDVMLDLVLENVNLEKFNVKKIYCRDFRNLSGCLECGGCNNTGECIIEDDMSKIYTLLDEAKIILVSSPVFFYNVPSQLKTIIDRTQSRWVRRFLKTREKETNINKIGGWLIGIGATKGKNLFTGMELTLKYFYDALSIDYKGGLFVRGIDSKGSVNKDIKILNKCKKLGADINTWMSKC